MASALRSDCAASREAYFACEECPETSGVVVGVRDHVEDAARKQVNREYINYQYNNEQLIEM
jgi:hypothetical protein